MIEAFRKKIKSRIHSIYYRIRRYSSQFSWRHGILVLRIRNLIGLLIKASLLLLFLFYFYAAIGAISISIDGISIKDFSFSQNGFEARDLVLTQINATLIVTSIIALVASIENKYIYGVRAIEYIFPKIILPSFTIVFFLLFASMFFNILLLQQKQNDLSILSVFIISIVCIAYVSYRFASIFINPRKIKSRLFVKYYKGNLQHIKNAKPLKTNRNKELEALRNVTSAHISGNEEHYDENIDIYFRLLKITLYNNFRLVQEYYTESISHSDLIAHIISFSEILFASGKTFKSISLFNRLMNEINYYKLILVQPFSLSNYNLSKFVKQIKNIMTEREMQEWHRVMWNIMKSDILQTYFYSVADFSYCRLAAHDMIHYFSSNSILADYYMAIYENKHFIELEKRRIYEMFFDSLRMSELELKQDTYTVDEFKSKDHLLTLPSKLEIPFMIQAEPIALLFVRMIEKYDTNNLKLFIRMNLPSKMMLSARMLAFLSVIAMLSRDNMRTYYMDIKIDPNKVVGLISDVSLLPTVWNTEELLEVYSVISECYAFSTGDSNSVKGSYYGFSPVFRFEKNVVDTCFHRIYTNNGTGEINIEDKLSSLTIDNKVQSIIDLFFKDNRQKSAGKP